MSTNSFYSFEELRSIGFRSIGRDVRISRKCSIYAPENVSIGDHVRIDDFCLLTGSIEIGSFVHISAYVGLFGMHGIAVGDFANISIRTTILSATDDFSGEHMTGSPVLPDGYAKTECGKVTLEKHSIVGAYCLVFPNLIVSEGTAVAAMSLVTKSTEPWTMYRGIPARPFKQRSRNVLDLEKRLLGTEKGQGGS